MNIAKTSGAELTPEDFLILMTCDGKTEQDPDSERLKHLEMHGLIRPAKDGETLTDWQKVRFCDNRYMPGVNWSITGKCNYNCRHCFMAKDNAANLTEFSWEEMIAALDEFDKCGIQTIELTGGEPTLHPRFMDLVREIARRGMDIDVILTNGALLTREMLREIKSLGFTGDFTGPDPSKCVFYNKGYYRKAKKAFDEAGKECGKEFMCLSPIPALDGSM